MTTGDTVFVMMTSGSLRAAEAWVTKATVIDGANNIVQEESGRIRVLEDFECVYDTQERAWEEAAGELLALARRVRIKADECLKKAAASRVVRVPA